MKNAYKFAFIGAGNMAQPIINAMVEKGIALPEDIIVSHSDPNKKPMLPKGVTCITDNAAAAKACDYMFLCVKPQIFKEIADELLGQTGAKAIISVMAGITSKTIMTYCPQNCKVIRVMPNTPCKIGKGMSAVQKTGYEEEKFVLSIFDALGETVLIEEELFDAVVAVSGSGPAYVFTFIKAMIDGGVNRGLDYATSKKLTLNTFVGACGLAEQNDNIEDLISGVCSKGGTTIRAIDYFNETKIEEIIDEAMLRCYDRSVELKG